MHNSKKEVKKNNNINSKKTPKNSSKLRLSQAYLQLIYYNILYYIILSFNNLVSQIKPYFDFNKHPFHKIKKRIKKHKEYNYYLHEILTFLFILFFFILSFNITPTITGYTIFSTMDSPTNNNLNTYTTFQANEITYAQNTNYHYLQIENDYFGFNKNNAIIEFAKNKNFIGEIIPVAVATNPLDNNNYYLCPLINPNIDSQSQTGNKYSKTLIYSGSKEFTCYKYDNYATQTTTNIDINEMSIKCTNTGKCKISSDITFTDFTPQDTGFGYIIIPNNLTNASKFKYIKHNGNIIDLNNIEKKTISNIYNLELLNANNNSISSNWNWIDMLTPETLANNSNIKFHFEVLEIAGKRGLLMGTYGYGNLSNIIIDPTYTISNITLDSLEEDVTCEGGGYFCHLTTNLTESLVLYMPFDVENNTNTIYDWSPNNYDGINADVTFWNSSGGLNSSGAYVFTADGSDGINLPTNIEINPNKNFTISLWFEGPGTAGGSYIFSRYSFNAKVVEFRPVPLDRVWVYFYNNSGYQFTTSTGYESVPDTDWHNVVVGYNGSGFIYLDGVYKNGIDLLGEINVSTGTTSIGKRTNNANEYNGTIDEVMIFNRSLSATEISDLYSQQFSRFNNDIANHTIKPTFLGIDNENKNRVNVTINHANQNNTNLSLRIGQINKSIDNLTGLVLYMPFEWDSDEAWDLMDYSDGTFTGGVGPQVSPTYDSIGGLNSTGAYNYSGAGSNVYITLTQGTSDNNFSDLCINGCTFSAWVNLNMIDTSATFIGRYDAGGGNQFFRLYFDTGEDLRFDITENGNATQCTVDSANSIPDLVAGQWAHIVGIYNTTDAIVYKDGAFGGNTACPWGARGLDATAWGDDEDTLLGAEDDSSILLEFNGTIDEVMVFNRSLSASEISNLYKNQSSEFNHIYYTDYENMSSNLQTKFNITNDTMFLFPDIDYYSDSNKFFSPILQDNITLETFTETAPYDPSSVLFNSSTSTQTNYTNETLHANFYCNDFDPSDTLTYDIYFYKDGIYNQSMLSISCSDPEFVTYEFDSANTTKGEAWSFSVNITDAASLSSSTIFSNNITIRNYAPAFSDVYLTSDSGNNLTTDNITVNYGDITELDSDTVYNITDWRINNISDMVLNMPFENTTNETQAKDYSSYQNNGNIIGAVCNSTNGLIGQGCYFDESSQIDLGDINEVSVVNDYTMSAWFKADSTDGDSCIVSIVQSSNDRNVMTINSDVIGAINYDGAFEGGTVAFTDTTSWHHIVLVNDAGVSVKAYLDNSEITGTDYSGTDEVAHSEIGYGRDSRGFNGTIDEVKIWNRTLSADEIRAIYTNESILHSDATSTGYFVKANVTINDGTEDGTNLETDEMKILSNAPTNPTLILNSTTTDQQNYTNETLACNFLCTDIDTSDTLTYDIYWYNNSIYHTSFTSISCNNPEYVSFNLTSGNTTKNELWSCSVNITDNNQDSSSTIFSNNVSIRNYAPAFSDVYLTSDSGNNLTTDNITINYGEITEIDSDTVYNITDWRINNISDMVLNMPMINNSATTVKDYSSYQNDGTITNAVCNITNGLIGQGCDFDGDGDYITIVQGNSPNNFSDICVNGCTFTTWIKPARLGIDQMIITRWTWNGRFLRFYVNSADRLTFEMSSDGTSDGNLCSIVGSYDNRFQTTNEWVFVTGVYNLTNMTIYKNTAIEITDCSGSINEALWEKDTVGTLIGAQDLTDLSRYVNGTIDEVKIWNRSLSVDEIKSIYANESILHSDATTSGTFVKANITLNDAEEDGTNLETDEMEILVSNPAPTQSTPADNEHLNTLTPTFTGTYIDADGNTGDCDLIINKSGDGAMIPYGRHTSLNPNDAISILANDSLENNKQYLWAFMCEDSTSLIGYSSNRTVVIDVTTPIITSLVPLEDNTTKTNTNLSAHINVSDANLYQVNITIRNKATGNLLLSNFSDNLNGSGITLFEFRENINITDLDTDGNYTVEVYASDTHTKKVWDIDADITTIPSENKISFVLDNKDNINMSIVDIDPSNANIDSLITTKETDRYTFNLSFNKDMTSFDVKVEADNIVYLNNSGYKGHIIINNKYWYDTEPHDATLIDSGQGYIILRIIGSDLRDFYFNSLGGLNTVTENYQFDYDGTYPLIFIDSPENTSYNSNEIDLNYSIVETNSDTTWYTNDSSISNYTLTSNLSLAEWNYASNTIIVYSNDTFGNENSTNITFYVNQTPINPTLILNSTITNHLNYTNHTIACNFLCNDSDDSDTLTYDISWYKDGIGNISFSNISCSDPEYVSSNLTYENTTKNELWMCSVNITDDEGLNSSTIFSNNVTIENYPPYATDNINFDNLTYDEDTGNIAAIKNADLKANFSDLDTNDSNNPAYYELVAQENSSTSCYFDTDNNWDCDTIANQSGMDNYTISLNDSDGASVIYNWNITINAVNDAPFGYSLNIPLNNTYTSDNTPTLSINNGTDVEIDSLSYYLEVWNDSDMTEIGYINSSISETATPTQDTTSILEDGDYFWRVLANDSSDNGTWTENRTLTIDTINPTSFNLSTPENGTSSTDTTPLLTWIASSDTNFDNYTIEVSNESDFSPLNATYKSTTNSFSNWSSPLTNGIWYWRVKVYDKASNSNISNQNFTYTAEVAAGEVRTVTSTETVTGGTSKKLYNLKIIAPPTITVYINDRLVIPLIISNPSKGIRLSGIHLEAVSDSEGLSATLNQNYISVIEPGKQTKVDLTLITSDIEQRAYGVTINARVTNPDFTDSVKIYTNVVEKGAENISSVEQQLKFAQQLFAGNPECAELSEYLKQARTAMENNEFEKALSLTENAINACRELFPVREVIKKKSLPLIYIEKITKDKNSLIIAAEVGGAILILIVLAKFIKRRKKKIHPTLLFTLFLLALPSNQKDKKHKRKFIEIRKLLLKTISKEKELTLNELATHSGVSWKTAKLHIIYLKGRGFVIETLSTPYVRIFKITEKGLEKSKNYPVNS